MDHFAAGWRQALGSEQDKLTQLERCFEKQFFVEEFFYTALAECRAGRNRWLRGKEAKTTLGHAGITAWDARLEST